MMNEMISDALKIQMNTISKRLQHICNLSYDQLNEEMRKRINAATELGKRGWTVNPSITPIDAREWINIIDSKGENAVSQFFSEGYVKKMFDELSEKYCGESSNMYLYHAELNYRNERYTDSAMFMLALLDNQIFQITSEKYPYKKKKQIEQGLKEVSQKYSLDRKDKAMGKVFLLCDYIPSLTAFALRLFNDQNGHECFTGKEPSYLNRNWLLHGRMTREVRKFEAIQLINALVTASEMESIIQE